MSNRQSRELKRLLEGLELATRKVLDESCRRSGKAISCKKGCSACCYLLATGMPIEGVVLAEAVLARPDWLAILTRAREAMLLGKGPRRERSTRLSRTLAPIVARKTTTSAKNPPNYSA